MGTAMTDKETLVGYIDEYGTVWSGEPGASDRIGDVIFWAEDTGMKYVEAAELHLKCDRCNTLNSCKITGQKCLHDDISRPTVEYHETYCDEATDSSHSSANGLNG